VSNWWPFVVAGGLLAVYWVLVIRGILIGGLWRRGGAPILRSREPTLFLTAAIGMTIMGLVATGALVWVAVVLGPLRQ
jgi:hypothetical protein